jgi:adenylate cyclase
MYVSPSPPVFFWIVGSPGAPYIGIACGVVTIILSFFWVEHVSQHNLMKYFFPKGGLSTVKGAKRIRISTRLFSLLFAGTFAPLFFIHTTILKAVKISDSGTISLRDILSEVEKTIAMESLVFGGLAILITFLVLQNLKQLIREIIRVLSHIRKGNLTERARIYSNDEIEFTGDVVNAMTEEFLEKKK